MELIVAISAIVILVVLYICFGALLSFIWGWWILILMIPLSIYIALMFGWSGVFIGLVLFIGSIIVTNAWQGTDLFVLLSDKIDSAFNFNDT